MSKASSKKSKRYLPFIKAAQQPLFLILCSIILGGIYLVSSYFYTTHWAVCWLSKGAQILLVISLFWLALRLINALTVELYHWGKARGYSSMGVMYPLLNNGLKLIAVLALVNIILPFLSLPADYLVLAHKAITIFLIVAMAWLGLKLVNVLEQLALRRCHHNVQDPLYYRKIHTQITVLKKITAALIIFLALASILMVSDRVREVGATLLASAGIIAAIATFAAQKTLSGVIGGVQIALTQPIHLNDIVMVENEVGTVEEINLSYAVVQLQDATRLVVPVNYFLEKPFRSLSSDPKAIQGTIRLFVHYSVSIDDIRTALKNILEASPKWNGKLADLQVVETNANQMVLQCTMSANDQASLWQLRCEVREKLIVYIKTHFPGGLGLA